MKKHFSCFLFLFLFVASISAQTEAARQIDEFSYLDCGNLIARGSWAYQEQKKNPDSKIYVIYYEGKHLQTSTWNNKTRSYDIKYSNPRRGDALSRANEINILLKTFSDFSDGKIVIVNGGYRKKFIIEIWIVPKNAEPPKATPTLSEKDIKFIKGKPFVSRDVSKCYDAS